MSTQNKVLVVSLIAALTGCWEDTSNDSSASQSASDVSSPSAQDRRARGAGPMVAPEDEEDDARWIDDEEYAGDDDSALFIPGAAENEEHSNSDSEDRDSDAVSASEGHAPVALSLPAALVGTWYEGAGHTSEVYDPATQTYGTPSGQGLLYTFKADGTYNKAFRDIVANPGCTTGYTAYEAGVALVQGSTLRLVPMTGTLSYRDTCAPSLDSDKPLSDLSSETFEFTRNAEGLRLVRDDGVQGQFRAVER